MSTASEPYAQSETVAPEPIDTGPITALGHSAGTFFFTNPVGEVRAMRAGDMTPNNLTGLFMGDADWLATNFPTEGRQKKHGDWNNARAMAQLIRACRREGTFDPAKQTRGPGVWPFGAKIELSENIARMKLGLDKGHLVIHTGGRVGVVMYFEDGYEIKWHPPGVKLGRFVYPGAAAEIEPSEDAELEKADIEHLQKVLNSWNWKDPQWAPRLALGALACAFMPAALPYRPGAYVQGKSGCGKSALLNFFKAGLGGSNVLKYENTTAARIRELYGMHRYVRCVIMNEAEATLHNERLQQLIEMARFAYSEDEGSYGRGGSGGGDTEIVASFIFGGIHPPPLTEQDANRMVMLRLDKLVKEQREIEEFEHGMPKLMPRLAPLMLERMIGCWPIFMETFNVFRAALSKVGHAVRGCSTLGTLLAGAQLLLHAEVPSAAEAEKWALLMDAKTLANRETTSSTEGQCLMHLMTARASNWGSGEQKPLGEYVRRVLYDRQQAGTAQHILKSHGIAVVTKTLTADEMTPEERRLEGPQVRQYVAVSNRHSGLKEIFKGEVWADTAWIEALRMLPGAVPGKAWFTGGQDRCTLLPPSLFPKPKVEDTQIEDVGDGHGKVTEAKPPPLDEGHH